MIRLGLVFFILVAPSLAHSGPDLVATLRVTGTGSIDSSGNYLIPIRVSVRNAGNDVAGRFKTSVEFSHNSFGGVHWAPVVNLGPATGDFLAEHFYAVTKRAMFAGANFTYQANAVIPKNLPRGSEIYIRAVADSCHGEEFMPYYCRVDESNERNNRSTLQTAILP